MKGSVFTNKFSNNLESFLFPVDLHNLYFDKDKRSPRRVSTVPSFPYIVKKFLAVVDEEAWNVLDCVSTSYTLITNEKAYMIGLDITNDIFYIDRNSELYFWYGEMTKDRGACEMNFRIKKKINIEKVENTWGAYLHIENSYNRTSPLAYKVGFYMETMDNQRVPLGVLIPSLSVNLSIPHNWKIETIENRIHEAVKAQYRGRDVIMEFECMVRKLLNIELVDDEILPLFCKLAKLKKLNEEDPKEIELARMLMEIDKVAKHWIDKCGCNAYAALCTYAEFTSKYAEEVKAIFDEPSASQSVLGKFMDDLLSAKQMQGSAFSMDEYIGKNAREVKNRIKKIYRYHYHTMDMDL